MYSDETVRNTLLVSVYAVVLPISDPTVEHLSDLHICNGHLLYSVYFEGGSVQHFLDGTGSALEYS